MADKQFLGDRVSELEKNMSIVPDMISDVKINLLSYDSITDVSFGSIISSNITDPSINVGQKCLMLTVKGSNLVANNIYGFSVVITLNHEIPYDKKIIINSSYSTERCIAPIQFRGYYLGYFNKLVLYVPLYATASTSLGLIELPFNMLII